MARPKTQANQALLTFSETRLYIEGSIGAKTASLSKTMKDDTRAQRESTLLKDLASFCDYLGKNPYQVVQYAKNALADPNILQEFRSKIEDYPKWLIEKQEYAPTSANTKYGNARGFLKWNNVRITLKNYSPKTQKAKTMEENALKFEDLFKMGKDMFAIADFEMKAYMALGLNAGLRISDIVRIKTNEVSKKLAKDAEFVEISDECYKIPSVTYLANLHRLTQIHLKKHLESVTTEYLFGDNDFEKTERNLGNKFKTLYQNVIAAEFKDLPRDLVTPHTLRAFFETILTQHGVGLPEIHRMDGHKPDNLAVYRLDSITYQGIIKACEKDLTFEGINLSMKTEEEIKMNFLKDLMDLINNQGKKDTLVHRVTKLEDNENLTGAERVEIEAAKFLEELYLSFKERLVKEFNLGEQKAKSK